MGTVPTAVSVATLPPCTARAVTGMTPSLASASVSPFPPQKRVSGGHVSQATEGCRKGMKCSLERQGLVITYPSSPPSLLETPCISGEAGLPEPCRFGVLLCLLLCCHPPVTWWVLLYSLTASQLEVYVIDFCQIPCLNGGRCIGRDECWCPANSTGKFCHLPAPKLEREPPERDSHHRASVEGPLRQSTFTLPLSNQLGKCGAGDEGQRAQWVTGYGTEGFPASGRGDRKPASGGGDRKPSPGLSSQSNLPLSPLPSGLNFIL